VSFIHVSITFKKLIVRKSATIVLKTDRKHFFR